MKQITKTLGVVAVIAIVAGAIFGLHHQNGQSKSDSKATITAPTPSSSQTSASSFNKKQYSIDDPASIWIVVNKQRPLKPQTYTPADLTAIGSGQIMRVQASQAYQRLMSAAKTAGYSLVPESGYRSYDTQVSVYGNEVKNNGQTVADTESARPGYSEHQTGWAVDIASPGCIEDCFGATPAAKWVLSNAASYGFIQRYPVDKSAITGYRNEPWHFRYVGTALAGELVKLGQTLEEFFGLPAAPNY